MSDGRDERTGQQREAEVLRHTAAMITLFSVDGEVLMQNAAAERAFGPIGAPRNSFGGRCRNAELARTALARLRGEAGYSGELEVETLDGPRWHVLEGRPMRDPQTGQLTIVVDQRDASESKRTAEAIVRSREAALEASRVKSQFLANMSHELRTPMNGVLGMLQLTLGTELSQEQREFLGAAHGSAESLLRILNDILDLSKIEAGKLDVESVPLNVHEVLRGSLQTVAPRAHAKGIELIAALDPELPDVVVGDPVRLRQVLTNLLGNAVKFTEVGHVKVTLSVGCRERMLELVGEVRDTGIGIAEDRQEGIFEAFEQADGSTTRRYGGTGLGLKICRQLLAMMGGRLTLESALGLGSTFRFAIPLRFGTPGLAEAAAAAASIEGHEVMVVDDHPEARATLIEALEAQGARVCAAANLEQALRVLSDRHEPLHAVLVDFALGADRGLDLAKPLRRLSCCRSSTRFVLLRSQELVSRAQLTEAGFDFALDKPVLPNDLRGALTGPLIRTPVNGRYSQPNGAGAAAAAELPRLSILIAEDHPINAHFLASLLRRQGHHVVHAWNGARALAAFEECVFDVILMDVQMPEMDGLEATRRIRALERTRGARVPIVALTANAMKGDEDACLAAGMDHYLSKPVDSSLLTAALERFYGTNAAPRARVAVSEQPADAGAPAFGREELLVRAAGDPGLMADLIQIFLATHAESTREIEASIASGNVEAVRQAAHKLKGALQLVCAGPAAACAKELELCARRGEPERFESLADALRRELTRLRVALGDAGA